MSITNQLSFGLSGSPGLYMPQIGLGTWQSDAGEVGGAVAHALRSGYRHLDLAKAYMNQKEVAVGIANSGVNREDIFITSKLWNTWHHPARVAKGLEDILEELNTKYLDLLLVHWPVAFAEPVGEATPWEYLLPLETPNSKEVMLDLETSLVDTWRELIKLKEAGKVKAIGVSNFTIEQIEGLIKETGVAPSVNQIERHPLLPQHELIEHHKKNNIHVTAYSPLGNNLLGEKKIVDYPEVQEIAKRLSVDPAQVLISWSVRDGLSVIPKSVKHERIESNFKTVELSDEDYAEISKLGEGKQSRLHLPVLQNPVWPINVFDSEIEKGFTKSIYYSFDKPCDLAKVFPKLSDCLCDCATDHAARRSRC